MRHAGAQGSVIENVIENEVEKETVCLTERDTWES